jgi:hypothetical protein
LRVSHRISVIGASLVGFPVWLQGPVDLDDLADMLSVIADSGIILSRVVAPTNRPCRATALPRLRERGLPGIRIMPPRIEDGRVTDAVFMAY